MENEMQREMRIAARALSHASAAIRNQFESGIEPFISDLDVLLAESVPPTDPLDAIDRILLHVLSKTNAAGEYVPLSPSQDYPIAYATGQAEMSYLIEKAIDLEYLEQVGDGLGFRLSLDGWRRVVELRREQPSSDQAFVAMWFDQEVDAAYTRGIQPALEATGYKPVRIDKQEHNEKIDDRIIAAIRKSGLLIADFTGHRGGVYFEAGFAMGLGLPVIWTCRSSDIQAAHFDTRQYNHIVWSNPDDLRDRLIQRIEATVPPRSGRTPLG